VCGGGSLMNALSRHDCWIALEKKKEKRWNSDGTMRLR